MNALYICSLLCVGTFAHRIAQHDWAAASELKTFSLKKLPLYGDKIERVLIILKYITNPTLATNGVIAKMDRPL